jgi:ferric-dicitrate binding protein FerR (iron transport regulator)
MKPDNQTVDSPSQGIADEVRRAVRSVDDRLDDMTRARLTAALAARLDGLPATSPARSRLAAWRLAVRRRPFTAAALPCALALAALVVLARLPHGEVPMRAAIPSIPTSPSPRIAAAVGSPVPSERTLSESFDRLEVPAGTSVRARLRDTVKLTLVGPATLEVMASRPAFIEVSLRQGTLLATYDGAKGGTLRIHAPDQTVEIVGTLFMIDVKKSGTSVSVAHGRVVVRRTNEAGPVFVGGNQTLVSGMRHVGPLDARTRDRLDSFESTTERDDPAQPEPGSAAAAAGTAPARDAAGNPGPHHRPVARADVHHAPGVPRSLSAGSATSDDGSDAHQVYLRAEAAMRRHDGVTARRTLEELVGRYPDDPLVEVARYELAQLAFSRHEWRSAAADFQMVASRGRDPALREAAAFSRCDVDRAQEQAENRQLDSAGCWIEFRRSHPGSPRDADALAILIARASRNGDCRSVSALADEYARLHPDGPFAAEAASRRRTCP